MNAIYPYNANIVMILKQTLWGESKKITKASPCYLLKVIILYNYVDISVPTKPFIRPVLKRCLWLLPSALHMVVFCGCLLNRPLQTILRDSHGISFYGEVKFLYYLILSLVFLLYDRCKSGLTFIQKCSRDVLGAKILFYFVRRQSPMLHNVIYSAFTAIMKILKFNGINFTNKTHNK